MIIKGSDRRFLMSEAIDLHIHTNASDGTDSPRQLLSEIRKSNIGFFSITDHDDIDGCRQMRKLLMDDDPLFLNGVEFSCKDEMGRYHILGYAYDLDSPKINALVSRMHALRIEKIRGRIKKLAEHNYRFSQEDIDRLLRLKNPGKPHLGNLMVKYGYAEGRDQAIRDVINDLHVKGEPTGPAQVIEAITESGGLPVLAHPVFGSGNQKIRGEELENRIRHLMRIGLAGVEGFYSGFSPEQKTEVIALAEKYDLYITAGSDYHGFNKKVALGQTNLGPGREWPEGLIRFIRITQQRREQA